MVSECVLRDGMNLWTPKKCRPSPLQEKCIKKSEFMTTLLIGTVFSYVSYKNMSCFISICIMTAQNLHSVTCHKQSVGKWLVSASSV
jgi:hypothetical protein